MAVDLISQNTGMVPQTSLNSLLQGLSQQATPQPLNPQGYRNSFANAQLGLLNELRPGGGQFDQYQQNEVNKFQNQVMPQIAAQMRGLGMGAFQQAMSGSLQNLMERLGSQRLGYEQNRQSMLGNLLGQGQQLGQRQQEIGLSGLQNIGLLQQRLAEAPVNLQMQLLQALLSGRSRQAAQGLGQGGDTAVDQGALMPLLQLIASGAGAFARGGV